MINIPMVEFTRKVMELFQEEKVDAHVIGPVRDLLDQIYSCFIDGSPNPYVSIEFWRTVEGESCKLSSDLIVGTISYTVAQTIQGMCNGIFAIDAIDRSVWVSDIVDQILSVVGSVCIQELDAVSGHTRILEDTDAGMYLVHLAKTRAAIKLLKSSLAVLKSLKLDS